MSAKKGERKRERGVSRHCTRASEPHAPADLPQPPTPTPHPVTAAAPVAPLVFLARGCPSRPAHLSLGSGLLGGKQPSQRSLSPSPSKLPNKTNSQVGSENKEFWVLINLFVSCPLVF